MADRETQQGQTYTITIDGLGRVTKPDLTRIRDGAREALNVVGGRVETRIKTGFGDGDNLSVRTGKLANTVRYKVKGNEVDGMTLMVMAGSRHVPYARVHEFGGVIRPRTATKLRVPLPIALTASGAKKGGYEIRRRGFRYFTANGKETWLSESGKAIMVEVRGKPTPIHALVKQVKIKPRLGIRRELREAVTSGELGREMTSEIRLALGGRTDG